MKVCVRCASPRGENSFYSDGSHPGDICKACIHRPRRAYVSARKIAKGRTSRTQAAFRYVMKQAQSEGQSFVYLVRVANRLKIGFSTNIDKRIRQLSTANSNGILLIAVAPGGRELEQELHQEFKTERIKGEWFFNRSTIVDRFSSLLNAMVFLPGYVKQDAPLDAIE